MHKQEFYVNTNWGPKMEDKKKIPVYFNIAVQGHWFYFEQSILKKISEDQAGYQIKIELSVTKFIEC